MYRKFLIIIFFIIVLFIPHTSLASDASTQERILNYHSDITINKNSSMKVTETIKVQASGDEIKRGIYRDFPTKYKDKYRNNFNVNFKILSIKRDGQTEPYHTANMLNGVRIYIGQEDVFLNPGTYTYKISYQTKWQLGFFSSHDELYWNVTGNGWIFPIDLVSATVHLPKDIPTNRVNLDGFTGHSGSQEKFFTTKVEMGNDYFFQTTKSLESYENLSIVIGWPKGYIDEPSGSQQLLRFFVNNLGTVASLIWLIIILIYYLLAWSKVGRDPQKSAIMPNYTSPLNLSPAAVRYIQRMSYDDKIFTSSLINLAVKGQVKINEKSKKNYLVMKNVETRHGASKKLDLSAEEKLVFDNLLGQEDEIELKNENYQTIQKAKNTLKKSLANQFHKKYFFSNIGYFVGGLAISILVGVLVFLIATLTANMAIVALVGVIIFIINFIFLLLLRAPTIEGRKVMDNIEGFQWFLTATEKDRLNFRNPPERTPELFEQLLPYALALGVEQKWSEQFNDVFARLKKQGTDYHPIWYMGNSWNITHAAAFSESLGSSFSHTISASAMPPGSSGSSGFGGGGSSGGGGGGGGGGW